MKTTLLTILIMLSALIMVGCESDSTEILIIDEIPLPPQGVYSVTGDNQVFVYWDGTHEEDIAGYIVYRSFEALDNYQQIGTSSTPYTTTNDFIDVYRFIDNNVINGETYFYAIASVDHAGQESLELSYVTVFDTPRPEGTVTLYDNVTVPEFSALIFGEPSLPVAYTNTTADFFIDKFEGLLYINAVDIDTDIQDMGFTYDFDAIGYAPDAVVGWSTLGSFELLEGHTYIFWTRDNHYAKVRVLSLTASSVSLQWAFQTDSGNPELAPSNFITQKPIHSANYLNKNISSNEQ